MAYITIQDYNHFKDYIHPRIKDCINHYRHKNIINLPAYRGCDTVNKNGTRKLVDYRRGYPCLCPTDRGYWRKTKVKYRINYVYFTRYMSQYGLQSLAKIKGKSLYNYRLKKFVPREEVLKYFYNRHPGLMAAKWVDETAINPIMNYFADRQHTEKALRDIENTVIISTCFYCKRCKSCQQFETYRNEFVKKDFWSFNKEIKYWDVYDSDWSFRNRVFKLQLIRRALGLFQH